MGENKNILGCFVSSMRGDNSGALFRKYIFGENGIADKLKKLHHEDYGTDLILILFQFQVNPIPYLLQNLKEIENYRKNEKSIGIPVVITDENFLTKSEEGRYDFFKKSILQKLDLLEAVVKKKKLDTNMKKLKEDLSNLTLNNH